MEEVINKSISWFLGEAIENELLTHEVSSRGLLLCHDGLVKFLKFGVDINAANAVPANSDEIAEQVITVPKLFHCYIDETNI